jgi:flagellar basal-body rod protein FlgF/flagellar basal-body rod protein FlgG
MNTGFYAACAGLSARMRYLEVVANNLANVNTTGYRAQQADFRSLLAGSPANGVNPLNRATNDYGVIDSTRLDLTTASLETTGNPLDVALEGQGFFAVQGPSGILYTRAGHFRVSPTGRLTTAQGDPVLGQQGPIAVPNGTLSISGDGTLSVDGAIVGKLRLSDFPVATPLTALGHSYYAAPAGTTLQAAQASVRQGMLESSNVNPVEATVGLITAQREAEMMERALATFSSDLNHIAASELSRI